MLHRILLASAGAMALSAAARAAEPLPPPPPPPPMWTGFYAGLNVGVSWLGSTGTNVSTFNAFDIGGAIHPDGEGLGAALGQTGTAPLGNNAGIIAGGQIGYNYQFGPSFLVGIEADIQGLGVRGHGTFTRQGFEAFDIDVPPDDRTLNTIRTEKTVDWLGTVRGRLGWLVTPTFLIFGDGGFAYGRVSSNTTVQSFWIFPLIDIMNEQWVPGFGSFANTRGGWTAGGGVEWLFLPNWSLKVEYLYYDLGSVQYGSFQQSINFAVPVLDTLNVSRISTRFNGNIVRVGLNYHFFSAPPPVVAKY